MDHAISSLRDYARATAVVARDNPLDDYIVQDLRVMVKAINIMEKHHYGKHITSLEQYGIYDIKK